ncbi:MAG: ABC transporter ATP-binding protein [Planctomycetes bacterium]|nr:ABC transporter ATP-binding protein [Planctomycetota bacterium]
MGDAVVRALDGVDLVIGKGEFVAVMGPSGSGKSTLLNLLGCLDRPDQGQYLLDGQDVASLHDDELSALRSARLGFIFQSFNLIQSLNVVQNIGLPLVYGDCDPAEAEARSRKLAARVGLTDRCSHRPMELSGGQQQRVAIARSLANNPVIILADEPTGNLDSRTGNEIMALLAELHAEGRTIVMVTHEDDIAAKAQRVVTMRDGRVQHDTGVRS